MSDQGVIVTPQAIYELLLEVKETVDTGAVERRADAKRLDDHETRLREIEQREDLARQVAELKADVRSLQRRVWAIPGASVVISGAAVVIVLIRWL